MRHLALPGLIALAFGVGGYYATGEFGAFSTVNLAAGAAALFASAASGLRSLGELGAASARRVLGPRLLLLSLALAGGAALEVAAHRSGARLDLTANRRYELAPATRKALAELPGSLRMTLYYEALDPRTRRIRMLLREFARAGPVELRERVLDEAAEDVERFEIAFSNSVVVELGPRFEVVERPTEGSLLEAILLLSTPPRTVLDVPRGEGEGNLSRDDEGGYAGLAHALRAEGYRLRERVSAGHPEVPEDTGAVLLLAPERDLRPEAYDALRRYLEGGGRLVALLEPGAPPGLVGLLEDFGFGLPEGVVVDPASGPVDGAPPGVNPIAFVYAQHPVTRGLNSDRMTFFAIARAVLAARKPTPADRLEALVYTSPRAWISPDVEAIVRGALPPRPAAVRVERTTLAAAGRFPRAGGTARVVVFGDSDFASNRYLRALYNLDLVLNAVHWATEREVDITLRPKVITPNQAPLTPQQTLGMLYGVGLLLPELLLIAGAVAWQRRRGA